MPSGGAVRDYAEDDGPATALTHLLRNAERSPRSPMIRHLRVDRWEHVTFEEFHDDVRRMAKGLAARGIRPGDRVAIMSGNCLEWTLADYAIWYCGAISVPLPATACAEQIEQLLNDCAPTAVFLQTCDQLDLLDRAAPTVPGIDHVWVFEDAAVQQLQLDGEVVGDDDLDTRRAGVVPDSIAMVVYTAGTTGPPKGAMLSHRNLAWACRAIVGAVPELLGPQSSMLLQVPMSEVFGRVLQLACVRTGTTLSHLGATDHLLDALSGLAPTVLAADAGAYAEILAGAARAWRGSGRDLVFGQALDTAARYGEALAKGGPGLSLRLRHAVFDLLVYSGLRDSLGGRLQAAIYVGSGPDPASTNVLRGFGVPVHEGYGLAENCGFATLNRPGAQLAGTLGQPLPDTSVRIAADGEVQVRGGGVFAGYFNDPAATAEALTDEGWLRTSDLGVLDNDGFLILRGRGRSRFDTPDGGRVTPEALEIRQGTHRQVSQSVLVAAGGPQVAAQATVEPDGLAAQTADLRVLPAGDRQP